MDGSAITWDPGVEILSQVVVCVCALTGGTGDFWKAGFTLKLMGWFPGLPDMLPDLSQAAWNDQWEWAVRVQYCDHVNDYKWFGVFFPSVVSTSSKSLNLFPPTKQVCIFHGSDTQRRVSTGTAPRGSSGNTWLPEASPPSCIFAVCLQKTVRLMVVSEGSRFSLHSDGRYYHSRTPKHTDPAQATTSAAAAAPSAQPRLQCSLSFSEETAAGTSGLSSVPRGPALPSFMRGVHVFFYNLPASERKRLARYLLTYPWLAVRREGALFTHHIRKPLNIIQPCRVLHALAGALMMEMRRRSWARRSHTSWQKWRTVSTHRSALTVPAGLCGVAWRKSKFLFFNCFDLWK